jgi:hypothetical protein
LILTRFIQRKRAKNQPLQQDLESSRHSCRCGDDPDQSIAPSAVRADYSENKIQYVRRVVNGIP